MHPVQSCEPLANLPPAFSLKFGQSVSAPESIERDLRDDQQGGPLVILRRDKRRLYPDCLSARHAKAILGPGVANGVCDRGQQRGAALLPNRSENDVVCTLAANREPEIGRIEHPAHIRYRSSWANDGVMLLVFIPIRSSSYKPALVFVFYLRHMPKWVCFSVSRMAWATSTTPPSVTWYRSRSSRASCKRGDSVLSLDWPNRRVARGEHDKVRPDSKLCNFGRLEQPVFSFGWIGREYQGGALRAFWVDNAMNGQVNNSMRPLDVCLEFSFRCFGANDDRAFPTGRRICRHCDFLARIPQVLKRHRTETRRHKQFFKPGRVVLVRNASECEYAAVHFCRSGLFSEKVEAAGRRQIRNCGVLSNIPARVVLKRVERKEIQRSIAHDQKIAHVRGWTHRFQQ